MKVDAYLLCSHCLAVGIEKPYLWRGEVLDIKNPKGIYHLQCPFSDADSLIPACFVYPIDPGNTLKMDNIYHYGKCSKILNTIL